MRNIYKYALVGLAGYIIGVHETKYKLLKLMLDAQIEKNKNSKEEK